MSVESAQKALCARYQAEFFTTNPNLKVGLSRAFDLNAIPVNGLRHPPTQTTSGWYVWSGEYSDDSNFFSPLHFSHFQERYPNLLKYFGLSPGWRFLWTDSHEDVWFDEALLKVD